MLEIINIWSSAAEAAAFKNVYSWGVFKCVIMHPGRTVQMWDLQHGCSQLDYDSEKRVQIGERFVFLLLTSRRKGEGGKGVGQSCSEAQNKTARTACVENSKCIGGGVGGARGRVMNMFFIFFQFSNLTCSVGNEKSTFFSKTTLLLWFYGKPAGAK